MDFQKYLDLAIEKIVNFSPKVVAAILILIIGLWLTKRIVKITRKLMGARGVDST